MLKASRSRGNIVTWNIMPLSRMGNMADMFMYFQSVLTALKSERKVVKFK